MALKSMSLVDQCRRHFDSRVVSRGNSYYKNGHVEIDKTSATHIVAFVDGNYDEYRVIIHWDHFTSNVLSAKCQCPHFDEGYLCKHVWATLLAIDNSRIANRIPKFRIDTIEFGDEEDWLEDVESGTSASQSASIGWEQKLLSLSQSAGQLANPDDYWTGPDATEIAFVLNLSRSIESGGIIVEFWDRKRKKDGEWSKYKRKSLNSRETKTLSKEDGELVDFLFNISGNGNDFAYAWTSHSDVKIESTISEIVLSRLCKSGKFRWMLDTNLPVEESLPLRWDDAGEWSFRLTIVADEESQKWRLGGELLQGDKVESITTTVVTFETGMIMFPDRLGILADVSCIPWMHAIASETVEVPFADRDQLLERIYSMPNLPEVVMPEELRPTEQMTKPQGVLTILSSKSGRRGYLNATLEFQYDEVKFKPENLERSKFDPSAQQVIKRDVQAEKILCDQLYKLPIVATDGYTVEGDVEFAQSELVNIVRSLTSEDWIVESEGMRIRNPGAVSLSVSSGVDWFELDGRVDFDGVSATLPSLLASLKIGNRFIRLDDGSQGILPEEWLKKYSRLADLGNRDGDVLKFSNAQALLLDAMLAEQENTKVDRGFKKYREKLRSFDGVAAAKEPRGFHGELREYQREGLGWLNFLRDFKFGGCLADDMGLGKTVQVLALLQARRGRRMPKGESRKPSLIVVPKSLVSNWIEEAKRFAPRLRVGDFTGVQRNEILDNLEQFDVIVTTYGTMRRDIAKLKEVSFDYAILDEAQAIKNHQSQASKASRLLSADNRLAMSGTPIENHLGELWSLFEFLNPGMLGNSTTFATFSKTAAAGDRQSLKLLAKAIKPFILRRTKEKVLTELPKKTEQTLQCEMSKTQRQEYDDLKEYYRAMLSKSVKEKGMNKSKIHVLEALLRLRQAACHPGLLDKKKSKDSSPKLDLLLEQITAIVAEGHKALVFSQFTSLLSIVRHHLDKQNITYEYLDGKSRNRQEKVNRFQEDEDCPLFLISLKAGGTGLNLTAADYVFILDPWWNPAVEAQAIDRAHRIGQEKPVFAYRIICKDTVEEKILSLQKEKRKLADAIVSADSSLIRNLTANDLQLLLS